MAYGRLDVFVPDGPIQMFPLSEPTVTVGRSGGNTIVLDNNTISRYHFSLIQDQGQVYITDMDSANGTYVDGVRLPASQRRLLFDGDEILIGNLRIIYHIVDDSPTVKLKPLDETTARIELALANFHIDLQGPGQGVAPGAHISAELAITNTSSKDERYKVEISGPPDDWIRIDRPTPLVSAGDTSLVLINFKPARLSTSAPGDYIVKVRVYPKNQPADILETQFMLSVLPFNAFAASLSHKRLNASERFEIRLQNQGSADLPLSLHVQDPTGNSEVRLATTRLSLAPGQRRLIEGEARPRRRPLIGSPRQQMFDLIVRSRDHAGFTIPQRLYLTVEPRLPTWAAAAGVGALSLMGLLAVVLLLALLRIEPPQPTIAAFSVNKTQIARGDVLELSWQATDVVSLRVLLNGTPAAIETDPQRVSLNLDTSALSGEVEVVLEGRNGEATDQRSATILVYEPMTLARLEVNPPQLVRYVVQALNIDWNVPGAVSTRLSGLESFNARTLAADGPAGLYTDLAGVPFDPLVLVLTAVDAFGNTLEYTRPINVVNPECIPAEGAAPVYAGPAPTHQVVGTVPANTVVVVDARTGAGDWLRVIGLPGIPAGWIESSRFTCLNFAIPDLQIDPVPPTPPPTPTLTPLPTFTFTPLPTLTPTRIPTLVPPTLVPQFTPAN